MYVCIVNRKLTLSVIMNDDEVIINKFNDQHYKSHVLIEFNIPFLNH